MGVNRTFEEIFRIFVGWLLVFVGVGIILWALYQSYNVFYKKIEAPAIFTEIKEKTERVEQISEVEKLIQKQLENLLPQESINKLLNLISFSMFVGILIFGGSTIANIGIKILQRK